MHKSTISRSSTLYLSLFKKVYIGLLLFQVIGFTNASAQSATNLCSDFKSRMSSMRDNKQAGIYELYGAKTTPATSSWAVSNTIIKEQDNTTSTEKNIKYRRTSIYTMVFADTNRTCERLMAHAFGNETTTVSENFNDHNIGPYIIPENGGTTKQIQIEAYLKANDVAKKLVAKWFNRHPLNGSFNMDRVGRHGEYDASIADIQLALLSARGKAMLKDAGEELISKTFVIVYDFNLGSSDNFQKNEIGVSISNECYVYRLIWDEATANTFFTQLWFDDKQKDNAKKEAFDASSIFKLAFVGTMSSYLDLNGVGGFIDYEIEQGIKKLVTTSWTKLPETFQEFKLKFPLFSVDPIAAKIGTKEGLKVGDKFEVLEKELLPEGTYRYNKITVLSITDHNQIWDNTAASDWLGGSRSQRQYTIFQGDKRKISPGMLIQKL